MNGLEKAATLLMALGEDLAGDVLRHLKEPEIHKLTAAMVKIEKVTTRDVDALATDLEKALRENPVVPVDAGQFMQNVLAKTLGDEKASEMMANLSLTGGVEGLETIRMMEAKAICNVVQREHPQVIAFVLASLDPEKASQVLDLLPEELIGEVVYRISRMEDVHPEVLNELEEAMKGFVVQPTGGSVTGVGGTKFAAELVNRMESTKEKRILEEIKAIEEAVCQEIEDQLFVFEDVVRLDDRTLQTLLKEISTDVLVLALRGTDEEVQEKFFSNMSTRAAAIIKEEMEMRGPVRLKEVEQAQQELVATAKALEQAGKITLSSKGGDEVYV